MSGRPTSRSNWAAAGAHREYLEELDKIRRTYGLKSYREIAAAMERANYRIAHSTVQQIMTGETLPGPADGVPLTRNMVVAMIGDQEPAITATETAAWATAKYTAARREHDRAAGLPQTDDTGRHLTRRPGVLIAIGVGAVLLVVALVVVAVIAVPPSSAASGPAASVAPSTPIADPTTPAVSTPTSPTTAGPVPAPVPGGGTTIQAAVPHPGGCSSSYDITGTVRTSPSTDAYALWVAAELYADPERNDPHDLYFAKAPVTVQSGTFFVHLPANTESGVRKGRFILVASPTKSANDDLALSLASNIAHDNRYPDTRRTQLQKGNTEIASTPDSEQHCP